MYELPEKDCKYKAFPVKCKIYFTDKGYFKKVKLTSLRMNDDHSLRDGDSIISEEESDYHVVGFSLLELKRKFDMTYPAALLTMDWLIKDSENAIRSINRGIK